MNLQNELPQLLSQALLREIITLTQEDSPPERAYQAAMNRLPSVLTREQLASLTRCQELYAQNRVYAAEFGFRQGIYGGFRQIFTANADPDGGFQALVVESLFMQPNMQGHAESFARLTEAQARSNAISQALSEPDREQLLSVDCAWSDRIYRAALDGFYRGYCLACSIQEQTGSGSPTAKRQTMEYTLGIIP